MHTHGKRPHRSSHRHGNRTLDMDKYAVNSKLAPVNPGLKVAAGVMSLFCCLLSTHGITAVFVAAVMLFISLGLGKIQWNVYYHMMMIPFSFILLSAIVLLVDLSPVRQGFVDIPFFSGYLSITGKAAVSAAVISIKAFSCVNCLYMISLSTPLYELIGVLKRCRIPGIMVELMYLIYRFIFILLDAFHSMNTSAGARLGYCNYRQSYRTLFGICTNLLVVAFKRAAASFDAMEARCYDGTLLFLEQKKGITPRQLCLTGIYFIVVLAALLAERSLA